MLVSKSNGTSGHAMAGGDGPLSYNKNSSYQGSICDAAKLLIQDAVAKKLSITNFSDNTFRIADLGCSTGPNTFFVVKNIIEAVKLKYHQGHLEPTTCINNLEFQVFFNDHECNDFNTLFRSLPKDRKYYASGVPGSFHGRLLPRSSLHFVHSSFALQWLSKSPDEITNRNSPAWNKGRIYYVGAGEEVIAAYSHQHAKDVDCFLSARAQEMVPGGLVAIIIPARPDGIPHSQVYANFTSDLLGSCLMELARKGRIDEEEVDSFNIPIYLVSAHELQAVIVKNGCFSLERTEILPTGSSVFNTSSTIRESTLHMRAVFETLISEKFGHHILDELFDLVEQRLNEESRHPLGEILNLFLLLKRK